MSKRHPHAELVKAVMDLLTLYGCSVFPVKQMATPRKDKRTGLRFWSRGQMRPGVADVCGLTRSGRFVAVECKVRDRHGKLDAMRPAQVEFREDVLRHNGIHVVADVTVDAVIAARGEIER